MPNAKLLYTIASILGVVDSLLFRIENMSAKLSSGTCDRCGDPIDGEYGYEMIDCVERPPDYALGYAQDESHFICYGCRSDFRTWMNPDATTLDLFASVRSD